MTGDGLVVSEIFGPTFQGEGPTAGRRCGFVRLGRCNLTCSWCDTPYTWDWGRFDPTRELARLDIAEVTRRLEGMGIDRVVVTGGEPLLQQRRLVPLVAGFAERGWTTEVETNGTIVPDPELVRLVAQFNVSPKLASAGVDADERTVPDALAAFAALARSGKAVFKFVATGPADLEEIAELVGRSSLQPVWVMPEGTSAGAVRAGLASLADGVLARGWNLGSRLHVLVWGDERGR